MAGESRARAATLTGERGVGKTTLCLELARRRPAFAGLVSPAILDHCGHKVGFSALCLQTGEQWDLGRSDVPLDGPVYGKYSFSAEGIARGIQCLEAALARPGRIVVLDEIGPLEMEKGNGFAAAFPLLAAAGDLLLVSRPRYASRLAALLPAHLCQDFLLSPDERGETAAGILDFFARRVSAHER